MKPAPKVKMLVKNGRNWRFYSAHWTNVTSGTNRPAGAGPFGPTGGSGGHNTHLGERALNVGGVCVQRQAPTPGGGQLKPISCWQNFARVFLHFLGPKQLTTWTHRSTFVFFLKKIKWMKWRGAGFVTHLQSSTTYVINVSIGRSDQWNNGLVQSKCCHWRCTFNNFSHFRCPIFFIIFWKLF